MVGAIRKFVMKTGKSRIIMLSFDKTIKLNKNSATSDNDIHITL